MGMEPTYPSEKYGYIIPESKDAVSGVSMFKENRTRKRQPHILQKGPSGMGVYLPCVWDMF